MRIGSLFSGIGALDLAVEAVTGGSVAWHCETDPYASHVLARHWPGVPNFGDVTKLRAPPRVDALCGGFPCQDVSDAGLRKGLEGARSGLWREYARIIEEAAPSIVFVENVAGLLRRGFAEVLSDLARLRFDAQWCDLTAAAVGAPHRRRRLFVLAYRNRVALRELQQQQADTAAALARCDRPPLADTVHDGCSERGAGHHDYGSDASWRDPHRRDALARFPPGPDDVTGWHGWIDGDGPQPGLRRGVDGVAAGVDGLGRCERLRSCGNAVVPRQAAAAFRVLIARALADVA